LITSLGTGAASALTQTLGAGTCTQEMNGGMFWGSVSNAQGTADGMAAAVDLVMMGVSNRLSCSNYGFTIPANSIIKGITLAIRKTADGGMNNDDEVKLLKTGVVQTENKADPAFWGNMLFTATYGSAADLWMTTWTAADINDAGFGAIQSVRRNDGAAGSFVDSLVITVEYDLTLDDGAACMSNMECTSTFCADGVCCNTACDGANQSCNQPGSVGVCLAQIAPATSAPAMSIPGLAVATLTLMFLGFFALRRESRQ
jgi:hypothetical protein